MDEAKHRRLVAVSVSVAIAVSVSVSISGRIAVAIAIAVAGRIAIAIAIAIAGRVTVTVADRIIVGAVVASTCGQRQGHREQEGQRSHSPSSPHRGEGERNAEQEADVVRVGGFHGSIPGSG
ncbi:MAG TPA: hypothetical protein VM869_01765 [Enhygromyxa sp.]|nr:hypothetical protein [Enhygromyxa sp.]